MTPILAYILWVYVIEGVILRKLLQPKKPLKKSGEKIVEGEFKIVGEKSTVEENKKRDGSHDSTEAGQSQKQKTSDFSLHNKRFVVVLYVSLIAMIVSLVMSAIS